MLDLDMLKHLTILLFTIFAFWSCEEKSEPEPNYRISLIDFEKLTLSPDSLLTYFTLEFNVTYDYVDELADAGPYAVSDVNVVWTSNLYYTDKETGEYEKCDDFFDCQNVDVSKLVTNTLSVAGENNIYINELLLSKLRIFLFFTEIIFNPLSIPANTASPPNAPLGTTIDSI